MRCEALVALPPRVLGLRGARRGTSPSQSCAATRRAHPAAWLAAPSLAAGADVVPFSAWRRARAAAKAAAKAEEEELHLLGG